MESDDVPVHDLLGVGDEAAPGPDPLRAIVARAGRRRLRLAAGGMALALVAGGAIGYSVSNHGSNAAQTATAGAPGSAGAAGSPTSAGQNTAGQSAGASPSIGSGGGTALLAPYGATKLTRLFTRTAGPVTIRGYQINFTMPRGVPASCQVADPTFQAEVSTADMVGVVSGGLGMPRTGTSSVIALDARQLLGVAEGDPTEVVTVATGAGVANVHMAFAGGGTDQMAPVQGWAALAAPATGAAASQTAPLSARVGQLTAFNSSGHQVASMTVTNGFNISAAGGAIGSSAGPVQVPQPDIACAARQCGSTPTVSPPGPVNGAPVPGSSAVSPAAPSVSTGGAASGSISSSGDITSGGAAVSPGLVYACPVHPTPASGAAGSGAAGSGAAGSGAAGSGTASSGATTSASG